MIFLGMDIIKQIRNIYKKEIPTITNGMNDNELKAHNLAMENIFSLMDSLLNNEDIVVHINSKENIEEYTVEDFMEKFDE